MNLIKLGELSQWSRPRIAGIALIMMMAIVTSVLAWTALDRIKAQTQRDLANMLSSTLYSIQQQLNQWTRERREDAGTWARTRGLTKLVKVQLTLPKKRGLLIGSQMQAVIRSVLTPIQDMHDFLDYQIIAPGQTVIAASRNSQVGLKHALHQRPELIRAVFAGQARVSLPLQVGVPWIGSSAPKQTTRPVMFVAAPIHDEKGRVIAVLAISMDPRGDLSQFAMLGRIGNTGETYLFDRSGRMLTQSRFDAHLRRIGLLGPDQPSLMNIEIRDPGGNLEEGFKSRQPRREQPLTLMATSAISKGAGQNLKGYRDYRGVPVIGVWTWDIGLGYGIATEIDVSEAYRAFYTTRQLVVTVLIIMMLLALGLASLLWTMHTRGQRRLKSARDYLQAIYDTSPDMIFLHAGDGRVVDVNDNAMRNYGFSRKEVLAINPEDMMGADYTLDQARERLDRAMAGEDQDFEWMARHKNGEEFPVEVRLRRLPELPGEARVIAIVRDLSQQRETEAQIARLAKAVEQANDAILLTDADGIIEYANPSFERLSGYSAGEVLGKKPSILKSGEHTQELYEQVWGRITSGLPWTGTLTNKAKDGKLYEVEQVIQPIKDESGQISGYTSMQRDVTYHRKLQSQIEHTQRLESLGVLAGGIAHDFNNLLAAIMGHASLARSEMKKESPAQEHLKYIENASDQAANLCKQMLAYSGKGKFLVKRICLSDLVREMGKLLEVSISKKSVLKYELADMLPSVEADVAQMQQVVMNLITNANEAFGEKEGVITVSTGTMHADAHYLSACYGDSPEPGDYVYLVVSDNGCGMDEETKARIFDPFFTTKFTGRGLGMSAVLGIMRSHQGALNVYTEPGKGTTFKILLPVSEGEVLHEETTRYVRTNSWEASGTILVVDDENTIRQVVSSMLKKLGFDVKTASNGAEALEIYRQDGQNIRAVLLDMMMPVMDGKECLARLQEIDPQVKVILSSGYSEQEATQRFIGKGLAGFIQKPYHVKALKKNLRKVLK